MSRRIIEKRRMSGNYEPHIQRKGYDEMAGNHKIKNGTIFWTVHMEDRAGYDTLSQDTAIIISELLKIKRLLKRRRK